MARYLFIRITEIQLSSGDVDGAEWVLVDKTEPQVMIEKGSLYEPPSLSLGDKTVVCVPASKIMLTMVTLPKGNINRLRKIVPFALEEFIIEDVAKNHFSIGDSKSGVFSPVAVMQDKLLSNCVTALEAVGLNPVIMVPDSLCIPYAESTWTIFIDEDIAIVRTGRDIGFSCSLDMLVIMLTQYLKEEYVTQPSNIKSYNVPSELHEEVMNIEFEQDVEYTTFDVSGNTTMLFVEQYLSQTPSINLLQGKYSRRQKMGQHLRPWIPVAGIFASWLVLNLLIDIVQYNKLSTEVDALMTNQIAIFKSVFPKAKRVKNPVAQMESRLKQLRKKAGKNSSSCSTMLAVTSQALKTFNIISIKSLRYRNSRLDVDIKVKNLQVLDKLKQQLTNNGKWSVEVLTATSRDDIVESRIQIRG